MSNNKKRENDNGDENINKKDTIEENESKKPKIEENISNISNAKKFMPFKNLSSKASSSFKSPLMNRKAKNVNENIENVVNSLEDKLKVVEEEITILEKENHSINELDVIIKKLHDYNEMKDIAQELMGKIAFIKGATIREIHKDFNADIDE